MRYKLRMSCIIIVVLILSACYQSIWDSLQKELSKTNGVTTTIHSKKFSIQQQFDADKESLAFMLNEIGKEKIEHPMAEEDFSIVVSGDKEYELKVFKNAIVLNDGEALKLTATERANFQRYYEDTIYGKDATLLQQVIKELQLGKYLNVDYTFAYEQKSSSLDSSLLEDVLIGIHERSIEDGESVIFTINLLSHDETIHITVNENKIGFDDKTRKETYLLDNSQFDAIFSIVIEEYLIRHRRYDDFSGSDRDAPDFLNDSLQDLYRRAQVMYDNFDLGTLDGDSVYGLIDCVNVKVIKYEYCYTPTNYQQFLTYEEFYDYVSSLFSDSLRDQLLARGIYQNIDDHLYVSEGDRGSHEYFLKNTYELIKENDDLIQFYLIGHYSDDTDFHKVSETKKFLIEIKKFDEGWRFTKFAIPY